MDLFFFYLCLFFDKLSRLLLASFGPTAGKGLNFCSILYVIVLCFINFHMVS